MENNNQISIRLNDVRYLTIKHLEWQRIFMDHEDRSRALYAIDSNNNSFKILTILSGKYRQDNIISDFLEKKTLPYFITQKGNINRNDLKAFLTDRLKNYKDHIIPYLKTQQKGNQYFNKINHGF